MGIHEKGAWVSIGAIMVLYIPYFIDVYTEPMTALYRFWYVAIGMAVILSVFHAIDSILHLLNRRRGEYAVVDELDQRIQHKAALVSGGLLACMVMIWVIVMMYALPMLGDEVVETTSDGSLSYVAWPITQIMHAVQWLFASFVGAQVLYYGMILGQYRSMSRE